MDPVTAVVVAVAAVTGFVSSRVFRSREADAWRARAEACGLTDIEQPKRFGLLKELTGRRGRHEVRIERFKRGKTHRGTRVTVRGLAGDIEIRREGFGSRIQKTFGSKEYVTGDAGFDGRAYLLGPDTLLCALLDADTRAHIRNALAGQFPGDGGLVRSLEASVVVAGGEIRCEFNERWGATNEPQVATLNDLIGLAERLAPVARREPRIAQIAGLDPSSGVRLQALTTLVHEFPDAAETRDALRAALRDADPEIRLQAGLRLGEEGRPTLQALAASIEVPDACSARAVDGLGGAMEHPRAVLESVLSAGRLQTAQGILMALAREGAAHVDAIAPVLDDPREEVAAGAARALGTSASPAAEEPLLRALERTSELVRQAAATALGFVGTARSVIVLRELPERARWKSDRAAREAVDLIQSRLTGAAPGQLALAGDASGQVSLSEDPQGRVALPDPPEGDA